MAAKKRGSSPKISRVRGKAKSIRKKTIRAKNRRGSTKSTEVVYHSTKEIKVERALIENFIGLQKVMVNLSARFDSLSSQISSLLQLFEISAKSLARKAAESHENLDAKKVMEKIDRLSAQAGLIGRGLALIHEVGTEKGKPMIPTTMQNKGGMPPQKSALPPHIQVMHPSILGPEPVPKMNPGVAQERRVKNIPGSTENVSS